jgi:hypothetical protein
MTFTSGERYEGEWQVCMSPRTTNVVFYTTHTEHSKQNSRALYSESVVYVFKNYTFISTTPGEPLMSLVNYDPAIQNLCLIWVTCDLEAEASRKKVITDLDERYFYVPGPYFIFLFNQLIDLEIFEMKAHM